MSSSILEMKNITKKFVGTVALRDVSINLQCGEILAILGENGAGKSTLMKILSGNYPSNSLSGEIIIEGISQRFASSKDSENAGVAMIHQEINLGLDLSIAENIMLGRWPVKKFGIIDWKSMEKVAVRLLESLNIFDVDVFTPVRNLSASMQQLVSIARALYREPKILILDEPTSCLTETETENLFAAIQKLRKNGISCLYISHKLDEIFTLCDRVIVLRDGRYISQYKKQDFNSEKIIEDIVGRQLDTVYPSFEKTIGNEVLRVEHFKVAHPFAYGKTIIDDVSFCLKQGEILGICGLMGSGRSELLGAIFGAIPKLAGKVYINEAPVNINNPSDAKRHGMGMLTEDRKRNGFIGCLSIRENITVTILKEISKNYIIRSKLESDVVDRYMDKLRIKARNSDTNILALSGGNQQKVIVAKWLATNLHLLFLDEPTRGIDVGAKAEIYALIKELAAKGISIVVISSETQEILGLCDRILILSKGTVRMELEKGEADEAKIIHYCSNL